MPATTIRVKPPGIGVWGVLGTDYAPGIHPQGIALTANEAGPDTCNFTIRRDSRLPWAELLPFSAIEVEVDGSGIVWGGRVWDTTFPRPDEITVTCRGYQYALEDNMHRRLYVRAGLTGFTDVRAEPGANTGVWVDQGLGARVETGGSIALGWDFDKALSTGWQVGVVLDLGHAAAKTVYVDWASLTGGSANVNLIVRAADDALLTTNVTDAATVSTGSIGASGTVGGNLAGARRYVAVLLSVSTGFTTVSTLRLPVTDIRVFGETTYADGSGFSQLAASTVATDVVTNMNPGLSTSTSLIETTSFDIPHLATDQMSGGGYATPRQILTAVNAYHDYLAGVDELARLYFKARPTAPETEIGEWAGADFSDAGDTGEELYNRVLVQYTDGTLQPQTEDRSATSPLLDLGSVTRSKVLSVATPVTQAAAQQIGDKWLESRTRRPTRGSVTVRGSGGARYTKGGAPVNPADYLRMTGSLIRLMHRWSPDDGGWGRDGTIRSVTYTPDTDTATLSIDSERDRLDVLLGRLAAVRGAGIPLS